MSVELGGERFLSYRYTLGVIGTYKSWCLKLRLSEMLSIDGTGEPRVILGNSNRKMLVQRIGISKVNREGVSSEVAGKPKDHGVLHAKCKKT